MMHDAQALITANIKAHTVDGYTSYPELARAHQSTIRRLCSELAALRGSGYEHAHQLIADAITATTALADTHAGTEVTADALTDALLAFEDNVREHEAPAAEPERCGLLSFGVAAHNRAMERV
jgi:hypothetical protein